MFIGKYFHLLVEHGAPPPPSVKRASVVFVGL
jgi:hypothetical protein